MADTRIAGFLLDGVVPVITGFVTSASSQMITIIAAPAVSLLIIYVLLWGAGISSGQIQEPFTDGMRRILRMVVIVCFALSAGIYSLQVASFFLQIPTSFASALIGGTFGIGGDNTSIANVIDEAISKGFEIGGRVYAMASSSEASYAQAAGFILMSLAIYFWTIVIGAVAAAILFVAYIALALVLSVGPIFILAALFQSTQRFFELWLAQVLNFVVLFIMMALAVCLAFAMYANFITSMPETTFTNIFINTFKIAGISVAIIVVMLITRGISSALAGGVAMAGQNVAGRLGRALGGAYSTTKGANRALREGDSRGGQYATPGNARLAAMMGAPGRATASRARQTWQGRNSVSESR
ncbi:MAG: type IV secretion system protein [Burkholderiales bacterium]|nr:type IV secretion system protein [Burkholderiales bacterium]